MSKKTQGKSAGAKTVSVTLIKSPISCSKSQKATVIGLGLRRIRHTVQVIDTPSARGMLHKVRHLVTVAE